MKKTKESKEELVYPFMKNKYGNVENINGSGWINPKNDENMKKAGWQTAEEILNDILIS